MKNLTAHLCLLALIAAPLPAFAAFHLFEIVEVYSNADGSVQFIELFTTSNFQDEMEGHAIDTETSTPCVFPKDLGAANPGDPGDNNTANKSFLVATPGFASEPGAVTPDYTCPAQFFDQAGGDTLNFGLNQDFLTFVSGELPTDGSMSLHETFGANVRSFETNSPTNFAGQTGQLPEPGALISLLAGATLLAGLKRRN